MQQRTGHHQNGWIPSVSTVKMWKTETTFIHVFQEIFTEPYYASGDTLGSEELVGNKKDNISAQKKIFFSLE